MLIGAVIKAEQVLFPFGKMEIRKRKKKKRNPEKEENPQERRMAFHRGVHKSWKKEQELGVEEGWQGNRGSNKIENLRSQSAEWNEGEQNREFHHHALSGRQSCQALPQIPDPLQTLCAHSKKNPKNLIFLCLFTGWRRWERGWGYMECAGKGAGVTVKGPSGTKPARSEL